MKKVKKCISSVFLGVKYLFHQLMKYDVLLDTPTHGNLGDQAIALSEIEFLKRNKIKIFEVNAYQLNRMEKLFARLTRKTTVVYVHGGGFLGDLWPDEEYRFRRIVDSFSKNKIIVFPQTITFDVSNEKGISFFEDSKRIYSRHSNMKMCVRDEKSYLFMKDNMPEVKVSLMPDIVSAYPVENKQTDRTNIMLCMRADREKALDDDILKVIKSVISEKYPMEKLIDTDTVLKVNEITRKDREKIVHDKLLEFSRTKLVVTDRLHGMIFAAITGTPCICFDNKNRKVFGQYKWLAGNQYIKYAQNINDFRMRIEELNIEKEYCYEGGSVAYDEVYKLISD